MFVHPLSVRLSIMLSPPKSLATKLATSLPLLIGVCESNYFSVPPSICPSCYEGRAKSSVTNRLPLFYPSYILKCFTALEWCVEKLTIPVYFLQIAFQLTELFQTEIDAVIYTDQFTSYIGTWTRRLKFIAILNAALGFI